MKHARFAAILAVVLVATAAFAAESLGNPKADEAVAALQKLAGATVLKCEVANGFVVCSGARTGDCLAESWLVNHDGSECRKKLE